MVGESGLLGEPSICRDGLIPRLEVPEIEGVDHHPHISPERFEGFSQLVRQGDVLAARAALEDTAPFGLALCLGNMLPHLETEAELDLFVAQVRDILRPGGVFLLQILNYVPVLAGAKRVLPVNVRAGDDGREIVFLRVMKAVPPDRVLFFPTTLSLDPDAEEPLRVESTRRVPLRAWTRADLEPRFRAAGMDVACHGDMEAGPFDPDRSSDLVLVARDTKIGKGREAGRR